MRVMVVRVRALTVKPCGGPVGTERDKEEEEKWMYCISYYI